MSRERNPETEEAFRALSFTTKSPVSKPKDEDKRFASCMLNVRIRHHAVCSGIQRR